MHRLLLLAVGLTVWCVAASAAADEKASNALLEKARRAAAQDKLEDAIKLATEAIQEDAKNAAAFDLRGRLYAAGRQSKDAVADFTQVIQLSPKDADAYDRRGGEQFKLRRIKESIADFDKAVQLDPSRARQHWRRGISYYYAAKYEEGQKQFEAYQTFDDADVENAVWRYLCMARRLGVKEAQDEILKIRRDRRVPMMQVYDLYRGKLKPAEVLETAKAGDPGPDDLNRRLFYAHLYLGLYYDSAGDKEADKKLAAKHIGLAVEHKIGHYMWDVAKVHAELLKQAEKQEK